MADVEAHITGTVWKIEVSVGDEVDEGDTVVILESMKMEMPVEAEDAGKVAEIRCEEGQSVSEGDVLVVLDEIEHLLRLLAFANHALRHDAGDARRACGMPIEITREAALLDECPRVAEPQSGAFVNRRAPPE